MRILITGANGFIGKNLVAELTIRKYTDIYQYDMSSTIEELDEYTSKCDFIFHLAGVNRSSNEDDFIKGNFGFTSVLLDYLKKHKNSCPIMLASSIQASLDNPYGISKKAGEDLLFEYGKKTNAEIFVYRFPNVFGKWCKPNYNSVIATFSHNIANNLPITVNDPSVKLNLIYIDDLVNELINTLSNNANKKDNYCFVEPVYTRKLGEIVELLYSFKKSRLDCSIPNIKDQFSKKLYSTYLSYLSTTDFIYDLKMNADNRGSFTEFMKSHENGQFSVNISKPGIVKGNHWHHTKNEKFLVVSGQGVVRFRKIDESEVIEYFVSGNHLQVLDIPPGYTHNIENLGEVDMVTLMWANEIYDPNKPDTNFLEV